MGTSSRSCQTGAAPESGAGGQNRQEPLRVDGGRNVDQDGTCEALFLRTAFLLRRGLQDGGSSGFCCCRFNHI